MGADRPCEGAIFKGKNMPSHARRHSAVSCAKMAVSIEVPTWTWVGRRKDVLHGAYWRNVMNTIEPSVCGGDAALCQITLTTCYNSCLVIPFQTDSLINFGRSFMCKDLCPK